MNEPTPTTENTSVKTTVIELLGKPFQFRCQEEEVASLQKAAECLNRIMLTVQNTHKLMPPEKIAIMAALDLASQVLALEEKMDRHLEGLNQRLDHLQTQLEFALEPENDALMMETSSVQA